MSSTKTFSHAGVSTLDGVIKVRLANNADRVKVLAKNGHTDIDLIQLKEPMNKSDAVNYLIAIDFDNGNAAIRQCLVDEQAELAAEDVTSNTPKEPKTPKVPKEPSMAALAKKAAAKVAEDVARQAAVDIAADKEAAFMAAAMEAMTSDPAEKVDEDAPY